MFNVNFEGIKQTLESLMSESRGQDVIQILIEDHRRVNKNFDSFEDASDEEKSKLAAETLMELALHAHVEQQLVYPLLEDEDSKMINEAFEEHHLVDLLLAELQSMDPKDDKFEAKFTVLGECVKHHVKEEEGEILPKLRGLGIDLVELGNKFTEEKERRMSEMKNGLKGKGRGNGRSSAGRAGGRASAASKKSSGGRKATGGRKAAASKSSGKSTGRGKTAAKAASGRGGAKKTTSARGGAKKTTSTSSKRSAAGKKGAAARKTTTTRKTSGAAKKASSSRSSGRGKASTSRSSSKKKSS